MNAEKHYKTLEFDKILLQLQKKTFCEKNETLSFEDLLCPSADEAREALARTDEMYTLLLRYGDPGVGRVSDLAGGLLPLLEQGVCLTVRELALSGGDLLALGAVPGPQMGRLQRALLEGVWTGRAANTRASLEPLARALLEEEAPLP